MLKLSTHLAGSGLVLSIHLTGCPGSLILPLLRGKPKEGKTQGHGHASRLVEKPRIYSRSGSSRYDWENLRSRSRVSSIDLHILSLIQTTVYIVPFMRYSLQQVQNRCILLPLLNLTSPMEEFPCDDVRKIILQGSQRMANAHSGEEILPKGSTP